jgi:hypothetical protein
MITVTMDQGEYKRIEVDYLGSGTPWDDLTGCTIEMSGKLDIKSATADFTAAGALGAANSDGKITKWGAAVPSNVVAGIYEVALTLSKSGATFGFPQIETCKLIVLKHA